MTRSTDAVNYELNKTGAVTLDTPYENDYYNIVIESEGSQTYTVKRKVFKGERYVSFEDNTMAQDSSATFYLPGTDSFEVTPSGSDEYSVIITSRGSK